MLTLSRTSRRIAGLLLLSVVAIESGGYFLTRVASGGVEMTEFQESFARAGHGHAGVLVILSLVGVMMADAAGLTGGVGYLSRLAVPAAAILMPTGFFVSSSGAGATAPNSAVVLLWVGAACLAVGVVTLGIGLLRSSLRPDPPAPAST